MRTYLGVAAATIAALATTVPAVPAHAAGARVCVTSGTASFNPPLTVFVDTGTVSFSYHYDCFGADTGGGSGLQSGDGSLNYSYTGSCVSAALTETGTLNPVSGVLVGGSAAVTVNTTTRVGARAFVLVPVLPSTPCSLAEATFYNVGPDVIL